MKSMMAFALAFALAPAPALSAAQQPAQADQGDETRLEGTEVMVDVVVLDKRRRPVTGLSASDFQVLEDGKEQQVSAFRAVGSESAAETAAGPSGAASPARLPTHRTVVVTDGTVQDIHLDDVRKALETYFRQTMTPNDFVTLFSIGSSGLRMLYPTSNDKEALIEALGRVKGGGYGTLLEAERAFTDAGRSAATTELMENPAPEPQSGSTGGLQATGPQEDPQLVEQGRILARNAFAHAAEFQALRTSWGVYDALNALISSHRDLPGRRSITIFSEGFAQSRQAETLKQSVVSAATQAGVSLYIVDARGLNPENERAASNRTQIEQRQNMARMRGSDANSERTSSLGGGTIFDAVPRETATRTDILQELAGATGGLFMKNSNDLAAGLFDIDRDLRNYYLLFYQPREPRLKGEFRRIEVKVRNRADVAIRAREGYFAVPEDARGLFRLEDQQLMIRASTADAAKKLPFSARPYVFGGAGGMTRVSYALEVPPQALTIAEKKGGKGKEFEASLYGLVIARDGNGRLVATQHLPWSLAVDADQAARLRAEGMRYEGGMDVPGTDVAQLEVVLSDEASGKASRATLAVEPADWSAGPALSDLVIGKSVIRARGAGDEQTFKQGEMYLVPEVSPVFSKEDTLNVLAAAYWPEGKSVEPPVLSVWQGSTRLAALPLEVKPATAGADGWIFTGIPVKDIPPGEYRLRITLRDAQGRAANRNANFTVK